MKYAVVFPGQGSQAVGMLSEIAADTIVAKTFEEANSALGYDLKSIILNGPEEQLNKTEITQPAILTCSVACYRLLQDRIGQAPAFVAGHSLGEYSALVAAGVIDFADTVRLVSLRGQAMQEAVPQGVGAMAAVLGLEDEVVINGCQEASNEHYQVWAANFNTKGQVVISGHKDAVNRAGEILTQQGAKRFVPLAVSVPSHCPLMQPAADKVKAQLDKLTVRTAQIPVVANCDAQAHTSVDEIKQALYKQLVGSVQWVQSVGYMQKQGVSAMIECGPNKVLCGLIRKIDRAISCGTCADPDSLKASLELLSQA